MKVIVAGSRTIEDRKIVFEAIEHSGLSHIITVVVSGCCPRGVDKLGEEWAKNKGIPIERYPANWTAYGKAAGPIRNNIMAEKADALILVWDGKSSGSKNMKSAAIRHGIKLIEVIC